MTVRSTNVPTVSLRARKKLAIRRALHRAAVGLVAAPGLGAVTVDDIAGEADVSSRTFFNYSSSKEDAISGMDPDLPAETVEQLRLRPPPEAGHLAGRVAGDDGALGR